MKNATKIINGFTLIELLIVVAIIGIIAAIAVPNFMNAWDKARQKRSVADLRTWGVAISSYSVDHGFYPFGEPGYVEPQFYLYRVITETKELAPPPFLDGWDGNFYYWPGGNSMVTSQSFTIGSFGKGHQLDNNIIMHYRCFQCDIRLRNGQFFMHPVGPQRDSSDVLDCTPSECS